jgi:3-isopropylmalate/(R)-2-methylmalate dehydratase large subunit
VQCIIVPDHFVPAPHVQAADNLKLTREFSKLVKNGAYYEIGAARVCHQVMCEQGHVKPGQIIVAPDSHATTYGAFGGLLEQASA